jgi:hypothetical protein
MVLAALGAASSALDALQTLTSPKSSSPKATGFGQAPNPFDLSGGAAASGNPDPSSTSGGFSRLSPSTMNALLAAQSQSTTTTTSTPTSPSSALQDLFSQLDTNGDGQISKGEFESALGAGGTNVAQADDVFSKLDKNGDHSVSLDELSSALKGKGHHHGHGHAGASSNSATSSADSGGGSADPLLQALSGASSTSVNNSDGSTTTSITYADGSKVTMTSPAAKTSSSNATSPYNFIEQMIAREAQALSSGVTQSLSLSV